MAQRRMSSLAGHFELMLPKPLDVNTITETLNRMFPSLQLVPTDIQKPTAELMCAIYRYITQYIMDIPDAMYSTPPFAFRSAMDMDLFNQAYPKQIIFKALSAIVEDISSNEIQFSCLDLVAPDPVPTRILLSTLINFAELAANAIAKAHDIFSNVDNRKSELESKGHNVIDLRNEVQRFHNDATNRKHLENECREKMDTLERSIKQTYVQTEAVQMELEAVCENNIEMEKKLVEAQSEIKRLTFQIDVADRDIVNSPDRLNAELNELTKYLETIQKETSADSRKKWEYKEKQKATIAIARSIEHSTEILNRLQDRQKEGAVIEETVAVAEEQRNEVEEGYTNIEEKLSKEGNKLRTMEKEFEKEESLHEKSLKDIKEHLTTLNEQVKDIRRRLQDSDKENVEAQREIGKVKNEIAALNQATNAESRNLTTRLMDTLNKYLETEKLYKEDYRRIDDLSNQLNTMLNASDASDANSTFDRSLSSSVLSERCVSVKECVG